jgi:lysophospholipase L1-like esterase
MGPSLIVRLSGSALAMAVAACVLLEYAVFRHAYLLADQSTVAIVYKGARLEEGHGDPIIVLGPSTALAIDARRLQQSMGAHPTVYNYALPNLGSAEQYYFVLKKYLEFNRRPELILLALPPDAIVNRSAEQLDPYIEEIERQRFRRFFGPLFLLTEVAPTTRRWSFVAAAAETALPSANYRVFIKNSTFAPELDEVSDREYVGLPQALMQRNRTIIDRLDATNGQLVYYADQVVAWRQVMNALPPAPDAAAPMVPQFEEVLRLADASGIPTRLVFTPICCERGAELERNGTWPMLAALMHSYEARYPSFRFMDTGFLAYERSDFGDPIHVNAAGAERFNAALVTRWPALVSPTTPRGQ